MQAVLPKVIDQIVNCKDQIAQQYLMEIICQVFPDNFHLLTLESFLETCSKLQAAVDVKAIVVGLLDRLANYASTEPNAIPKEIDVFKIFSTRIQSIIEVRDNDLACF